MIIRITVKVRTSALVFVSERHVARAIKKSQNRHLDLPADVNICLILKSQLVHAGHAFAALRKLLKNIAMLFSNWILGESKI